MEAVGEATGFASGDVSDLWPVEEIVIRALPRRSLKKLLKKLDGSVACFS